MEELAKLAELLSTYNHVKSINKLEHYKPYPYQVAFHNAVGKGTNQPAAQRLLCAANKIGKTFCGAAEIAIHATGIYPDWWKGSRFQYPVEILVCGLTNESVRDILQRELFGDPSNDKMFGTGAIPKKYLNKPRNKAGVPNAIDSCRIKHVSGYESRIFLRAYEQGWKKFQGIQFDVIWPDEEPEPEVWSQLIRATTARPRAIIMCTMTPEQGMTEVVSGFFNDLRQGQALLGASWDDAPHLTKEQKEQRLAALRPHEREMRSKGIPLMGAGLIFPVSEEAISVDPFPIPRHWPRITGLDLGWDHPTAAASLAWDRDSDVIYLISEYKESRQIPAIHAAAIKAWGEWIPVAWPHDGMNAEKSSGVPLADQYRKAGLSMLPWKASNPPAPGQKEGEGGNSVESSIMEMLERMETGRFKVFRTCVEWFKEFRMYHRDNKGKIVKQGDDLISASRYGAMMIRHARTPSVLPQKRTSSARGLRNWG